MSSSATKPTLISVPFANSGTKNVIPVPSQVSTDPGLASYTTGFPPATMTPKASGGIPPYGADMNGALNAITQWLRYINAGGILTYNTDFATAIGGYPLYARITSSDGQRLWVNTVDGNTTDPDAGGTGWSVFLNTGLIPIGMPLPWLNETVPGGYVALEGGSLSRTTYAALFAVYGVTFGAVDSTHFTLPKINGRVLRGWDHGAGVDPDAASRTNRGDGTTGDHVGTLQGDEVRSHSHTGGFAANYQAAGTVGSYTSVTIINTGATGGNETRMKNISALYITRYM